MKKEKTDKVETTEKQNNKGKGGKIVKVVINVVINVLIVLILVTSVLIAALSLTSKADPNGLPNVFGYTFQYVQTNSMAGGSPDGYEGGDFCDQDVIICKTYSPERFPEIEVGDIISYRSGMDDEDGNPMIVTHRVVGIEEINGETVYATKGDAAAETDSMGVEQSNILSVYYNDKYHGITLKGFADFFRTLRSQEGFFMIILIPMIIFFLYAIIRVVISAMNYRKEKSEEDKKEAVDAAVAAALAEKNGEADAKPETPADLTPEQLEEFKQFLALKESEKNAADSAAPEPEEET